MFVYWRGLGVFCVLLGSLGLGGYPVAAQTPEGGEPPLATQGPYTNQAEHWTGRYHLLRTGTQVTATLTTRRSPVQHWARQAPQALLRLPEGYRPHRQVTWTTEASRVTVGGQPGQPAPAVPITLTALPDGTVHYVDRPALDEVGHVAYTTTVIWETAESAGLREGEFTAAHWAGQYRLERLGHVVTATLIPTVAPVAAGPAVLFKVPAGFRPSRSVRGPAFPPGGTLYVLQNGSMQYISPPTEAEKGGVSPTPVVHRLQWPTGDPPLHLLHPTLAPEGGICRRLAAVQRALLTALRAAGRPRASCAAVTWADLASLQTLVLPALSREGVRTRRLMIHHQVPVPREDTDERPLLPHDLAGLTHLLRLRLNIDSLDKHYPLAPGLLVYTPRLQEVQVSSWEELPTDLLAYAPRLQHLELSQVPALPADFLAYAPRLQELRLKDTGLEALPADFLAHAPQLQNLSFGYAPKLKALPADFLAYAPRLQFLQFRSVPDLAALPADFLTHVPRLQELQLYATGLEALPSGFLTHAPQLRTLIWHHPELPTLPAGFLTHAPQLRTLIWHHPGLPTLPADFPGRFPALQQIEYRHVPHHFVLCESSEKRHNRVGADLFRHFLDTCDPPYLGYRNPPYLP